MFQHFVELFFAPWQVPFLTLSLRPYGPVQPLPAPGSLSAKALSHLSTEDQRALQCLQPHSCCTCQTSFSAPLPLLSAHVFPRLTTNPPFMCIIGSPETHWSDSSGNSQPRRCAFAVVIPSGLFNSWSLCLFVCFCLFRLNCEKPHSEKRSMRRRLLQSHSAKP